MKEKPLYKNKLVSHAVSLHADWNLTAFIKYCWRFVLGTCAKINVETFLLYVKLPTELLVKLNRHSTLLWKLHSLFLTFINQTLIKSIYHQSTGSLWNSPVPGSQSVLYYYFASNAFVSISFSGPSDVCPSTFSSLNFNLWPHLADQMVFPKINHGFLSADQQLIKRRLIKVELNGFRSVYFYFYYSVVLIL